MWVGSKGRSSAGGAGVGDAGGQADERVGIAVRGRQLGDAPRVHDVAERAVRGIEQRRVGADRHFLDGAADFQRHLQLQPIGDADVNALAHPLLEA